MTTYVYRDGKAFCKETGEAMLTEEEAARPPQTPMVLDFRPYSCPITGKEITTPGQHRANLAKHNCVEAKELGSPTKGEIRNANFAKKRGLKVSERYKDKPWRPSRERP